MAASIYFHLYSHAILYPVFCILKSYEHCRHNFILYAIDIIYVSIGELNMFCVKEVIA